MISRPRSTSSPVTYDVLPLRKHWARYLPTKATWKTGRQRSRETRRETVAAADRLCVSGHGPFRYVYPYRYVSGGGKVFIRNTWDWVLVDLRKSDVDYIEHHCKNYKECVPTLQKRGKKWFLDFAFQTAVKLPDTDIRNTRILAVDLGLNSTCTCSIMTPEGAVLAGDFFPFRENTTLWSMRSATSNMHRNFAPGGLGLWKQAKGINDDIAVKTAQFIVDTAVKYDVDCIVMEHLDLAGKKRGSRKQRLHLWRAKDRPW